MEATPTNAFRIVRLRAAYADEQNLRKDGVDKFRYVEYPTRHRPAMPTVARPLTLGEE